MAAAPRKTKITTVPNLYVKRDKRTGKISCQYKNIRSGTFHGLGSDLVKAERQANQLNAIIAQQIIDQETAQILTGNSKFVGVTVASMCDEYRGILDERLAAKEIKPLTVTQRKGQTTVISRRFGKLPLLQLDTVKIADWLNEYKKAEKVAQAKVLRAALKDIFSEAMTRGFYPSDKPNPAAVTKNPKAKVKRHRLTLDFFLEALEWSKENQPPQYWKAYVFALLIGQRLSDIGSCQFKDVVTEGGIEFFKIEQTKGQNGAKLLIPTSLRLECVGYSIKDIVKLCRDNIATPFVFHHTKKHGRANKGQQIFDKTISEKFTEAVRAIRKDWGEYTNPTFHELRSLAEREHRAQGLNTQHLLGHKKASTTEIYADARGHEFIKVAFKI